MKFYEKVLGGKIAFMMKYADAPGHEKMPPEMKNLVMHATLTVNGQTIFGADAPPDRFQKAQGIAVSLEIKDPAEADRVFAALSDNGHIQMPIQETFWAQRFGMLTDQFGTPWMVDCAKENQA